VLYIGDLLQLPPVIRTKNGVRLKVITKENSFPFARGATTSAIILNCQDFRQTDDTFISVLNNLRNNQISQQDIQTLNQYVNRL
jgi:hypothetical protein